MQQKPSTSELALPPTIGGEAIIGAPGDAVRSARLTPFKIASIILFVAALLAPFFFKNFVVFQLTLVMIYAIAILGLNLLTGVNGQFSLGHSAFYGIGAYTTAIMMEQMGIGYVWTLPVAGLVCFVFGFLFGLPALRLEGHYLALATFALAITMPQLLKFSPLEHWTGGVQGIVLTKPEAPDAIAAVAAVFGRKISSDQWLYFVTLITLLIMFWLASNLVRSRTGRALMAIRDNPIAARSMGVNIALYKSLAFGTSALFTGIAGALGAIVVAFVAPDSFTVQLSIALLVGLVVGGVGSIPGCLFGGLFVLFVPNIAESISKGLAGAFYGVILLLLIYVMPSGAAGFVKMVAARLTRK